MATYQAWAAPISHTLAHFQAWAQFFGGGFTTLGWVAQTGHGEVVATGTGASYAFTTPVLPNTGTSVVCAAAYTFKGAWVSGNTYVGGNSAGTSVCDLVTNGGVSGYAGLDSGGLLKLAEFPAVVLQWAAAPATSADTGTAGQVAYDTNYLYVCYATNSWARIAWTSTSF
jgi:hypothetical protein